MKVGELKKLIADLPDDMEVVVSGSDHSYNKIDRNSRVVKAEISPNRSWMGMYYDRRNMSDSRNKVIEVFWIDDGNY